MSLERSTPPASRSGEIATQTFSRSVISATSVPPPISPIATPYPTSSAEYIAGGIKRNKIAVILIAVVAVFFAGLLGIGVAGYFVCHKILWICRDFCR